MLNLTTMTYTSTGRLQSVTDANNHTTSYQYDSRDRLTTITYPDNTTRKFGYDSQGDTTTVVDERGYAKYTVHRPRPSRSTLIPASTTSRGPSNDSRTRSGRRPGPR